MLCTKPPPKRVVTWWLRSSRLITVSCPSTSGAPCAPIARAPKSRGHEQLDGARRGSRAEAAPGEGEHAAEQPDDIRGAPHRTTIVSGKAGTSPPRTALSG